MLIHINNAHTIHETQQHKHRGINSWLSSSSSLWFLKSCLINKVIDNLIDLKTKKCLQITVTHVQITSMIKVLRQKPDLRVDTLCFNYMLGIHLLQEYSSSATIFTLFVMSATNSLLKTAHIHFLTHILSDCFIIMV